MKHFIADLHLGHAKIAEYRGFDSVEDHDRAVLDTLHAVPKDDQIWVLGDTNSGSAGGTRHALALLRSVPAPMHLVPGNHEIVWPGFRDSYKHQRTFLEVFESVQAFARTRIAGHSVLMSHFPYTGDHTEVDRAVEYRLRDEGLPLLHGHTHSSVRRTSEREVCVSWEAWERPASENEIAEILFPKES